MVTERPWAAEPIAPTSDEALLAFALELLRCAGEPVTRGPKPLRAIEPRAHTASSGEVEVTTTWHVETASCTLALDRTESYFPGDVNEPARAHEHLVVRGARRDGTVTVEAHAHVGNHEMVVRATGCERAELLAAHARRFGTF